MPEATVFTIDDKGVNEIFNDPRGDIYKYMERQAKRVVLIARKNVGKKTGRLAASIGYRMIRSADGVYYEVTASNKIALIHHEGTRPHIITPRTRRVLKFKQGGRVVYAQAVLHPGTRPNPYLVTALREAVK